jgi:hypothetical protein
VWVSGTVLGFVGIETMDGDFRVKDIIYPSYSPRVDPTMDQQDSWIALVSGLNFGVCEVDLSIELLVDFLTADKSIGDVFLFLVKIGGYFSLKISISFNYCW